MCLTRLPELSLTDITGEMEMNFVLTLQDHQRRDFLGISAAQADFSTVMSVLQFY